MKHSTRLSYLMVLSWEIQRKKKEYPQQSLTSCMGYYVERGYNRVLSGEAAQ